MQEYDVSYLAMKQIEESLNRLNGCIVFMRQSDYRGLGSRIKGINMVRRLKKNRIITNWKSMFHAGI